MKIWKYQGVKIAIFFKILESIFSILIFYLLSYLVTYNIKELVRNVFILLLIAFIYVILMFLSKKYLEKARENISRILSTEVDIAVSNMNAATFLSKNDGERLSTYTNDINKVVSLVLDKFISRIGSAIGAIISFVTLISIHYSIGILAIISLIIMSGVPILFQKKLSSYISNVQASTGTYTNNMRELVQGFMTFLENKSFMVFYDKSKNANKIYRKNIKDSQVFAGTVSAVLTFFNFFTTVLSIALTSYLIAKSHIRTGSLVAVLTIMPTFGEQVTMFLTEKQFYVSGLDLFSERFSFAKGFHKILDEKTFNKFLSNSFDTDIKEIRVNNLSINFKRKLTFPNIVFEYGKKYAIEGESGSGKSSLLKAILGELNNYDGEILINGIAKNKDDNLFNKISYMNQETYLFNDTVKNNVDFNKELTDDEVNELLKNVGLKNIDANTHLTDNGKNLSGGQRQRLALIRALVRKKDILILDEATANLDKETEKIIEDLALKQSKTLIMITHRLTDEVTNRLDKVINISM